MRARHRLTGVVYVASCERRGFAYDELHLLELAADRIGTIIENASLYEQALAAVRSRDAVMGVVSHDLRNPLSAVQMSIELLPTDDPKLAKPVAIIKRSVDVMVRLISDLRDVGSIEASQLSITLRPEDPRRLVRHAVEGMQDAAAKKSVSLGVRLPEGDLVLDCDRIRISQVLTNLLTNALKFTPPGGSITISIEQAEGHARFAVEDTGSGIPEADLSSVFDRYWQAKATAHLGTGLGLAIAKGIVEAHGGTISVESRVDRGTTFSFTVPLGGNPARDRTDSKRVATQTGARVLVVDDEPNALSALASLLEEEGFVVEAATNGVQALAKLREFAPDILVVDVEMPGLNGPDLVREIRADGTALPVILMTGHDDHDVANDQLELRASYIGKPLDIEELVSAINRELDKER
jgi:CheY-like chemotaxis protein/nitrogen-specific signal transduction histidine kinase